MNGSVSYEFSRPFDVAVLAGGDAWNGTVTATPGECAALAKRFDALEITGLQADLQARQRAGGIIEVTGAWRAHAVQSCVRSLEPVPVDLTGRIRERFTPSGSDAAKAAGEGDMDAPEVFENGKIDLGEMLAQILGVSLPLYPHKADDSGDNGDGNNTPS